MNNTAIHRFTSVSTGTNIVPLMTDGRKSRVQTYCPDWKQASESNLDDLVHLPKGWDGYQALPVSFTNASFAMKVLDAICFSDTPAPELVPGVDGDLQIEWHEGGKDIEIHILGPNRVYACYRPDYTSHVWQERNLTNDFTDVAVWVESLREPNDAAPSAAAG